MMLHYWSLNRCACVASLVLARPFVSRFPYLLLRCAARVKQVVGASAYGVRYDKLAKAKDANAAGSAAAAATKATVEPKAASPTRSGAVEVFAAIDARK